MLASRIDERLRLGEFSGELGHDAEPLQHRRRVRRKLDAGADLFEPLAPLEDVDLKTALGKCDRGGQAGDACLLRSQCAFRP